MKEKTIVVAAIRPWNLKAYRAWSPPRGYRKVLIRRGEDLTAAKLRKLGPRYVFFPHWSWMIPREVYENFECILFHMTDLPFGRGGSPMQNLISRGIYKTKVSAIRVVKGLDAGPVYLKRPLDISRGSAEQLFKKLAGVVFRMMSEIVRRSPRSRPQRGKVVTFARRTPEMSRIPAQMTERQMYDFIRMLDAPEYPTAYLDLGEVRIEFRNARFKGKKLVVGANVVKNTFYGKNNPRGSRSSRR